MPTTLARPRVLVLTGHGINCDHETEYAFNLAGGQAERVHVQDLIDGRRRLDDYQVLAFPGGFSYGDDIAAGRVLAVKVRTTLNEQIRRFVAADKLVIGICNGFQVMMQLGLFAEEVGHRVGTLSFNDSARFEDRWAYLRQVSDRCVFTRGIEQVYFPLAHGEGNFMAPEETLDRLEANGQVVFAYVNADGSPANGVFPVNPNGSKRDIAGVCDVTGRIFGLMPHPERFLAMTNHPHWTRIRETLAREGKPLPRHGEGLKVFINAVTYFT